MSAEELIEELDGDEMLSKILDLAIDRIRQVAESLPIIEKVKGWEITAIEGFIESCAEALGDEAVG